MKSNSLEIACLAAISIALLLPLAGCGTAHGDPAQEAPPPATIIPGVDVTSFAVDHPEQYPFATAETWPNT